MERDTGWLSKSRMTPDRVLQAKFTFEIERLALKDAEKVSQFALIPLC